MIKKPKLNKNTLYFAWGTPDSRIKRHLIISAWDKKSQKWITHKVWVKNSDYYSTALHVAEFAGKKAVELTYLTLWVNY